MSNEYIQLQQAVKNNAIITDVEEMNNRVYFKVNGHQFQTFGNWCYPEGSPIYDHPVSDIWARKENTAEGIEEDEKQSEEIEKQWELFQKHEAMLFRIIFLRALEISIKEGDEKMLKYIHYHFDIMENDDHCQKLLNRLENEL